MSYYGHERERRQPIDGRVGVCVGGACGKQTGVIRPTVTARDLHEASNQSATPLDWGYRAHESSQQLVCGFLMDQKCVLI